MKDLSKNISYKRLLTAAHKTDSHVERFIKEILPHEQFAKAIWALQKNKPETFKRLQRCIETTEVGREERMRNVTIGITPKFIKRDLWEIVQEVYKTYSCRAGYTTDKSVRRPVTIYIRGHKPKKQWPADLIRLQDKLVGKVHSKRKWTFSFDSRVFTADLNQEEIDILRKNNDVYRIIEEPEAHILYGEYAPYPVFDPAAENIDWGISRLNVSYAWDRGVKGQGIKVGVVDTGIDMMHSDLIDRYKGGYNFVAGDDNPSDDHMHGTHCCGIVGASDNGSGYTGVAPLVDIYAIKVLNSKGSGTLEDVAAGVDWCVVNGLDIISLSLGANMGCSGILADSCNNAWNQGLVVVGASGNDGDTCPDTGCVAFPGNCSSVIAVGAIDKDEFMSGFSSFGPEVELIAPGEGITAPWLVGHDIYGGGTHIVGSSWYWANGTSMACPHVTGACALIKCWYPAATNYEIREWLRDNAKDL